MRAGGGRRAFFCSGRGPGSRIELVGVDLLVGRVEEVVRLLAALCAGLAVEEVLVERGDLGVEVTSF